MADFGIILLAAGNASRMGGPKQLLDFNGVPLIRHAVIQALLSECSPVIVVCGARQEAIRAVLSDLPVHFAINDRWEEGMGTSIQCGLRQLEPSEADGMILSLADLPLIDFKTYQRLVAIHEETGHPIVVSHYAGTVGVPVLFARKFFSELMDLSPGQGCKGVIQSNSGQAAKFDCPDAAADIDTPEDYERVLAEFALRRSAVS